MRINQSEFTKAEDLKRLDFITSNLQAAFPQGAKILDVGCGNGNISRHLGRLGFDVHGIDISTEAIEYAKKRNSLPNVKFEVKPAEQVVAEGQRYNAVVCSEILEHLHRPNDLVAVLRETLDGEGLLIVTVPNGRGPRELLMTRPMQWLARNDVYRKILVNIKKKLGYHGTTIQSAASDLSHIQFFTMKDLQRLSSGNKLEIKKKKKANFIEAVFPVSIFTKQSRRLQEFDCALAERLPLWCSSGFYTVWVKRSELK